jgi:RHS repeat-associated protein
LRTALDQALGAPPSPGYASGLAQGQPIKAIHIQELRNRVLTAWNGGANSCAPGQTLLIDQFVKNFYQGALARQPNGNELQSWSSQLRQAYYQGQTQLLGAAQYLGRQLFKSSEYAARNRDDHWFVYDLYWAYLQRQPDQAGWDYWTGEAAKANGHENVRHAFEDAGDIEFVAKLASLCPGFAGAVPIPLDGLANLTYDAATNHITTGGFQYDAVGNQTRTVRADGSAQKFQYDAANRLIQVRDDYGYVLATYTYGDSNERLIADESGLRTYYACDAGMEYVETGSSITPQWSKTYIYLGARLLSTLTPNGSGGELVQYHHPDRLGTRLVTNAQDSTYFEQVTLPFGTALDAESTGSTNRRFTSYERSSATGLDYAVNRHYDPQQGRFTQVDPIGMKSTSLESPQTLNLYAYCANDPVNNTDPSGLGFFSWLGKLFKGIGKVFSAVGNAIARVLNNRWVRIGVFILSFFSGPFGPIAALEVYNAVADIAGQLQLYGMLLQGKLKLKTLLLGYIGSYLATIENAVVESLQDWFAKGVLTGHFSFKGLFKSAGQGLWQGLRDAANQLLRYRDKHKNSFWKRLLNALIPGYGHWCAPGMGAGADEDRAGVDLIDEGGSDSSGYEGCRGHEYPEGSSNAERLKKDETFFKYLLTKGFPRVHLVNIAFGGGPSVGTVYKFSAIPFFGGLIVSRWAYKHRP